MGPSSLGLQCPQPQTELLEGRSCSPESPVMPHVPPPPHPASQGHYILTCLWARTQVGVDCRPRVLGSRPLEPLPGLFRGKAPENTTMFQTDSSPEP